MEKLNKKVIIIGSGPAGYTAALYLARAGYTPLVIAGALTPGGQLMNTTEVENYPGFVDGILGPDLMEAMQKQAEKFGAQIILNDVVSVDFKDDLKTVTTDDGETYTANAVIISTGSQVRKLGVPGEQEYSGRGVSYCATCDGFFFRGKPIVVVGGGDSAFEEALFLTRFGSSVTLIHRRDSFRASKIMIDRARKNEKIKFVLNSVVQSINGSNEDAQSVTVKNVVTGETQDIEASGIFVAIGHLPSTSFLNNSIALNEDGTISVQGASTKTSIPGVFAAGDVVDSVYRQAISAAGMGCRAALDAQAYLNDLSE
ncbi:thioredoxin-disulfide reductase [Gardnerella vaginalis]|jgi:thioredoxin-disulfide reductase|uniref:Thioredoxin reductase n=2 Tax=Gardnerella vaginalis TaxID=2702 RepID=A0A3E2CF99_GARVA|nr:thioredoxin-disulfide reductase [Gardnerella vaginalis]EPI49298.1 thioredoxin-disulfide reductase [Gardnerella vaginalis JCP8108]EPI57523.1 thioredoxin-disulfide reductase [Gardnerella vaginalis JCP7276]MDK7259862.1 thioredoxin-disulfide reductase [Gardnerella vaginalis]MDK8776627.1 thioredoxin-disulfide reductase [Gardnerella vaginalis]NSX27229.1 thioredoxin-disulfide reductase [Gardnerella vaginalis]